MYCGIIDNEKDSRINTEIVIEVNIRRKQMWRRRSIRSIYLKYKKKRIKKNCTHFENFTFSIVCVASLNLRYIDYVVFSTLWKKIPLFFISLIRFFLSFASLRTRAYIFFFVSYIYMLRSSSTTLYYAYHYAFWMLNKIFFYIFAKIKLYLYMYIIIYAKIYKILF